METTQLVQQQQQQNGCEEKQNGGCVEHSSNGDVPLVNGDCCETNGMLTKGETIELSASQGNIKCCNGFFANRVGKKNKTKIVKETQTNGNSNGKCYFSSFKEKLSNGKHTQLIEHETLIKPAKVKKPVVFDDRDPFKINSNVKFEYLNLFAEPNSGTYSFNPTWTFTSRLYFNLKLFLYRIFAILIGIPSAFFCAIFFALFSVVYIWILTPVLRLFKAVFGILRDIWATVVDCVFGPIFQTIAVAFRHGGSSDYTQGCPSSVSSKSIYNEDVNVV